jgi:nucleoid-associated protein YgaU
VMMNNYTNNPFYPDTDTSTNKGNQKTGVAVAEQPINPSTVAGLDKEAGVSAPSIYLRPEAELHANEPPALHAQNKELDVLWSSTHNRTSLLREETHPVVVLASGFVSGVILTTLAFWFIFSPSSNPMNPPVGTLQPKVLNQQQAIEPDTVTPNNATPQATTNNGTPANPTENSTVPMAKGTVYKVKSGDTLGSIAESVYGEVSPALLDRILKANNLANANKLSLDQELIIPPKNY